MSAQATTVDWPAFLDRYDAPVFVTGTQRSGTTLMCRMLSAHGAMYVKNELPDAAGSFRDGTPESVVAELSQAIAETAIGVDLAAYLEATGKSRWGLKDPGLTNVLFRIPKLFPAAKTIIMVRDARAVTLSYLRQRWGSAANVYGGARRWVAEIQRQESFVALNAGSAMFVRYEHLLGHPEEALRDVCEFLGVGYDEQMLHYHERDTEILRHAGNANAFQPIDVGLGEKWRTELSARDIALLESIAGEVLERHGFELTTVATKPSTLRLALLAVQDYLVTEVQQQLRWRLGVK